MGLLDHQDRAGQLAALGSQVAQVRRDLPAHLDLVVLLVLQGLQAVQVLLVLQDRADLLVLQVLVGQQDLLV